MQKIDTIEIKNFKSIRHQKIEGCRRINVFIGYPNVGKSNILEAMGAFSFIQGGSELNLNSILRFEKFPGLFFDGNTSKLIEITLNKQQVLRIKADSISKLDFSCNEIGPENNIEHEIYNGSIRDRIDGTTGESQKLIREIFWFSVKKYNFLSPPQGKEKVSSNFLSFPTGQNLYDVLSSDIQLKSEITELFKGYDLNLVFDQATKELKILKKISDTDILLLPYYQIADTLQRLIFYKTAILSNKESILLFEEPEAHMFPPYIAKFTTDIIFDENNNQYFIATHSPFVLSEFIEEAQNDLAIYVVDYDKGETIIKRLTDGQVIEVAQYGIDLFFNLEPYLDKYGQPHSA